jgi:hypothetical protein
LYGTVVLVVLVVTEGSASNSYPSAVADDPPTKGRRRVV